MNKIFSIAASSAVVLGALISAGAPAYAAPAPTSVGSLDRAVTNNATSVRWRGGHWHGGWGWGYPAAVGFGVGYGWGWGWPGYYYGAPYYAPPPVVYQAAPAPVYRAEPPRGAVRQCWVDTDSTRGFGYWRPC